MQDANKDCLFDLHDVKRTYLALVEVEIETNTETIAALQSFYDFDRNGVFDINDMNFLFKVYYSYFLFLAVVPSIIANTAETSNSDLYNETTCSLVISVAPLVRCDPRLLPCIHLPAKDYDPITGHSTFVLLYIRSNDPAVFKLFNAATHPMANGSHVNFSSSKFSTGGLLLAADSGNGIYSAEIGTPVLKSALELSVILITSDSNGMMRTLPLFGSSTSSPHKMYNLTISSLPGVSNIHAVASTVNANIEFRDSWLAYNISDCTMNESKATLISAFIIAEVGAVVFIILIVVVIIKVRARRRVNTKVLEEVKIVENPILPNVIQQVYKSQYIEHEDPFAKRNYSPFQTLYHDPQDSVYVASNYLQPVCSLTAQFESITLGESIKLYAEFDGGEGRLSFTIALHGRSFSATLEDAIQSSKEFTVSPSTTTTYSLLVENANGFMARDEVTIVVSEQLFTSRKENLQVKKPSCTLSTERESIAKGGRVLLKADFTGGSARLSHNLIIKGHSFTNVIEDSISVSRDFYVTPSMTTKYLLSVQNSNGQMAHDSVTITVDDVLLKLNRPPPPTNRHCLLMTSATSVSPGEEIELTGVFSDGNATLIEKSNGLTSKNTISTDGDLVTSIVDNATNVRHFLTSLYVKPFTTTTYTLQVDYDDDIMIDYVTIEVKSPKQVQNSFHNNLAVTPVFDVTPVDYGTKKSEHTVHAPTSQEKNLHHFNSTKVPTKVANNYNAYNTLELPMSCSLRAQRESISKGEKIILTADFARGVASISYNLVIKGYSFRSLIAHSIEESYETLVAPTMTTTYTLLVKNSYGQVEQDSVTIIVDDVLLSLAPPPLPINRHCLVMSNSTISTSGAEIELTIICSKGDAKIIESIDGVTVNRTVLSMNAELSDSIIDVNTEISHFLTLLYVKPIVTTTYTCEVLFSDGETKCDSFTISVPTSAKSIAVTPSVDSPRRVKKVQHSDSFLKNAPKLSESFLRIASTKRTSEVEPSIAPIPESEPAKRQRAAKHSDSFLKNAPNLSDAFLKQTRRSVNPNTDEGIDTNRETIHVEIAPFSYSAVGVLSEVYGAQLTCSNTFVAAGKETYLTAVFGDGVATLCDDDGSTRTIAKSGEEICVTPFRMTTYTLLVEKSSGEIVTSCITINVFSAVTANIIAQPSSIMQNHISTLTVMFSGGEATLSGEGYICHSRRCESNGTPDVDAGSHLHSYIDAVLSSGQVIKSGDSFKVRPSQTAKYTLHVRGGGLDSISEASSCYVKIDNSTTADQGDLFWSP